LKIDGVEKIHNRQFSQKTINPYYLWPIEILHFWQFLKLTGQDLTILRRRGFANDVTEYALKPIDRILGVLKWMIDGGE
jgi:hypothetical protein